MNEVSEVAKVGGPPRFKPTGEQRKNVEVMVGLGIPLEHVRAIVRDSNDRPISEETLRTHFRKEIEQGVAKVNAQMGNFIVATALGVPPPPGVIPITDPKVRGAFTQLFARTRMGWADSVVVQSVGKDGGPIQHEVDATARMINDITRVRERLLGGTAGGAAARGEVAADVLAGKTAGPD